MLLGDAMKCAAARTDEDAGDIRVLAERLGLKVDEIMALTRKVLEAEVRAAVRDAMAAVITAETARLKGDD